MKSVAYLLTSDSDDLIRGQIGKPGAKLTAPGFTPRYIAAIACLFHVLLIGNRQFPAALGTATGQNPTAILGAHALTKAVLVGSFSSRRLESPFHCIVKFTGWKSSPF